MPSFTKAPSCTMLTPPAPIATRMAQIAPFHVMELMRRAQELEAMGRRVIHMEVGEPDFTTPPRVIEAAQAFISQGRVGYTAAMGLPALREAIAGFYRTRYGVDVPAHRIVVTAGASGALLLALGVLTSPGDEWLLPDPGYPCNRHFVRLLEGRPRSVPVLPEHHFQPTVGDLAQHWSATTRGVMLASPGNPTGTLLGRAELAALADHVLGAKAALIVDEIYHGLTYGVEADTVLAHTDRAFVVNSFSKYFGMTGWRLGWLVVPDGYEREVEKLAQNLFISPSSPAQYGALAAFEPETIELLESRRAEYSARRDYLLPALEQLGLRIPATPLGAYYVYCDVSAVTDGSFAFAMDVLEETGVALTPGLDFGQCSPERYIRIAFARPIADLEEGIARLKSYLSHLKRQQ